MRLKVFLVLLVVLAVLVFPYDRVITMKISIKDDGSARVKMVEEIQDKGLVKIYVMNENEMKKSKDLRKEFFKEISKEFYYIYGTAPDPRKMSVEYARREGGVFRRSIVFEVSGIVKRWKDVFAVDRKNFSDQEKMRGFFEDFLDGKFFESAFADSEKSRLSTLKRTIIDLPRNSRLIDLEPFPSRKLLLKWNDDYGSKNVLAGKVEKEKRRIIIEEIEETSPEAPDILVSGKNESFFSFLRDIGAFKIVFEGDMGRLTKPVDYNPKWDFSKGWNYNVNVNMSYTFKDGPVSLTPGIEVGTNLKVHLKWEHGWVRHGWRWRYEFKKFEGKITVNPYTEIYVNLHAGASKSKSWSKTLVSKDRWFTFWVSGVPVAIVLEGEVEAKASVGVSGSIDENVSVRFDVNTSATFKYQHGWSKSVSKSFSYSGVQFSANAKVNAWAKGELPITFSGYVYNVSGPFLRLTPWIKGQANASAGSQNQVGYSVYGGLKLSGGVRMAGWLRKICGKISSKSYSLWSKTWTLKSGTYTF